ncbi:hypothetical protein EAG_08807 [Camponotus floridanus]|uniref:Uncharacterized protein n=1 Tax=Camponotus floridanus TaxID=104421 RepID=E2AYE3_CAMFO|nr:hypothetical protein EAG_08807 [Camponotus floridanus]
MPGVQPPSPTPFSGQPPPPRALPSILTATYTYSIRRPPTSPVSPSPSPPWHRFYHPQRAPPLLVSFHALAVLLSSSERASLSPSVSTSVFLKCPIQSARRVRYRKYGNTNAISQRECDNTKNFD